MRERRYIVKIGRLSDYQAAKLKLIEAGFDVTEEKMTSIRKLSVPYNGQMVKALEICLLGRGSWSFLYNINLWKENEDGSIEKG